MKLSVLLNTMDYRGDHAADVQIAFDVLPLETVEHLAERLFKEAAKRQDPLTASIEIRQVVAPVEGT